MLFTKMDCGFFHRSGSSSIRSLQRDVEAVRVVRLPHRL